MQYLDRRDAGRQLAAELMPLADEQPVIMALPRGGVPVGVEVATALGAPIEILAVRKIGAPGNPELAVGAVAEDGSGVLDPRSAGMLGMTQELLDERLEEESRELRRRVSRYRHGRPQISLSRRTAIVTLTHDPKLDDPALQAALRSPAFYIGALGSKRTHAARLQRLAAAGFTEADFARIHGPVGLSIGALSPAELAISVLGQITAVRRGA